MLVCTLRVVAQHESYCTVVRARRVIAGYISVDNNTLISHRHDKKCCQPAKSPGTQGNSVTKRATW